MARMEPSRRRAVKTMKKTRGKDYYEKLGEKPHRRGFSDPSVASKAARKRWEGKRNENSNSELTDLSE